MWQSSVSFVLSVLFLLGCSISVADTGPKSERATPRFSLVQLVEQAATDQPGEKVARISLVELVESGAAQNTAGLDGTRPSRGDVLLGGSRSIATEGAAQDTAGLAGTRPSQGDALPGGSRSIATEGVAQDTAGLAGTSSSQGDALQVTLLPSVAAIAENDGPAVALHLPDAVDRALQQHPRIVEAISRLEQQQEQVTVAKAGYLPQLSTGINTGYRHTTGRSEEALTVSASQMLYDFGKVSSAVEAAEHGVGREEAEVLLAAEDLIRDTAQAFIEAQRYDVLLELAEQQIEAIGELEALANKRSALGAATVSDEMQAHSRREAARATRLQMQAQRDQWQRALENLIGSTQRVTLADNYPLQLEEVCRRLPESFENSPRVVIAEAERAAAEASIRRARADQRPTLSLNADFEHYLDRNNGSGQPLDDQEFVVRLSLTSNLFQGGALSARKRAADHAFYSASAARDVALLELSRLYRETRDRSHSLMSSLALQDERHASIVKTQELYRHQYLSLGTRTLLDILNTEQEIFQTQVDKQNTVFDLRRLQIDCLYSVGGLREVFHAGDALNDRVSGGRAGARS